MFFTAAALTLTIKQLPLLYNHKWCLDSWFVKVSSSRLTSSSVFPSPSLERERCRNSGWERGDESSDAMWLYQIRPSCHQELICLNLSHCCTATIWILGRKDLASSTIVSAAWGAAGLLYCPHIRGAKSCSLRQEGRTKVERTVLRKWGSSGGSWMWLLAVLVGYSSSLQTE